MSVCEEYENSNGKQGWRQLSPVRHMSGVLAGPGSLERIDLERSELEAILEHAEMALSQAE
jgi:hypothetical protein